MAKQLETGGHCLAGNRAPWRKVRSPSLDKPLKGMLGDEGGRAEPTGQLIL